MGIEKRVYNSEEVISFFRVREKWGSFSNMHPGYPLVVAGVRVSSSEALYQAMRFPHYPEVQAEIIGLHPMEAKKLARAHIDKTRADWDRVRVSVMRWVLRVKAEQHPSFCVLLLSTGDKPIVEVSYKDDFWGARPNGRTLVGVNTLGRLLMELREELKSGNLRVVPPPGAVLLGKKL